MKDYPKRVLLVFGKLNRGGAETLAMNIYRNIDRTRIQFDFVVHTDEECDYYDEVKELGGRIFRFPRYNVKNHSKYKKCWKDFFEQHSEYKVIHAHNTGAASVFLPIAKKYGLYTIAHSHIAKSQSGLRQKMVDLYRLPLKNISDYMFACSDIAGQWMFGKKIAERSNYAVLTNGVDVEKFLYDSEKRKSTRAEFGISEDFVIGNVARFHRQKNHAFLMKIFSELKKLVPNSKLMLVGTGKLENELRKQADELGISKDVIFTGVREDIADILSAMDVFVMPSFREGLPVSLVEAQAAGIKIVASDTISKEICFTDLVTMLPLAQSAKEWACEIAKYAVGYIREDKTEEIRRAGYDIKTTAKRLENFYLECTV